MEMEMKSPPPCPKTVTIRRNPPRRARPTPSSLPQSSKVSSAVRSFPIEDIISIDIPDKQQEISESSSSPKEPSDFDKLKVFLRIRPIVTQHKVGGLFKNVASKNVWPQNPKKKDSSKTAKAGGKKTIQTCLKANGSQSVTLCPPHNLSDARRTKSEVYEGFSHVFGDDSSQSEVYERMMNPLVVDFLKGKSGMLAAMGPSGSGKTHTVFGSTRQPGMVSLALRQILSQKENSGSKCSRSFYLSMFEIYSERGKGEKIMDLSQEGGDLYMQQSNIKGLKEVAIHDVQQAESLIASGMLKRSTAMTNSNIQSSRSQCIINIRCDLDDLDVDQDQSCTAVLTIVDLAGAEREKRTGNQGARLLESNFINNTSMVFGLCLRSLLEHQKNPKKPLHKHFQNSMLTKYLRDFLEGKKRMSLILTVKPGEEDYHDTSYLLRQASPFMNIKFESTEEQPPVNKRRTQMLQKSQLAKRVKHNSTEICLDDEVKGGTLQQLDKAVIPEPDKEFETNVSPIQSPVNINMNENNNSIKEIITGLTKKARENQILSNFSRALWKVLKEYKSKLEASENEADSLRHDLTAAKEQCVALETELNLMKASCTCGKVDVKSPNDVLSKQEFKEFDEADIIGEITESGVYDPELHVDEEKDSSFVKGDQQQHVGDLNAEFSSLNPSESKFFEKPGIVDDVGISSVEAVSISDDVESFEEQSKEEFEKVEERDSDGEVTVVEKVSASLEEVQPENEEKEVNAPITSSDLEESKPVGKSQFTDLTDSKDQELVLPEDAISSQSCNDSKLPEVPSAQPCQPSFAVKPKRRLRPASSVLLKNINLLDVDDATTMPKQHRQGKRGENEEGSKKTQGSISLLRILKQNLHH